MARVRSTEGSPEREEAQGCQGLDLASCKTGCHREAGDARRAYVECVSRACVLTEETTKISCAAVVTSKRTKADPLGRPRSDDTR